MTTPFHSPPAWVQKEMQILGWHKLRCYRLPDNCHAIQTTIHVHAMDDQELYLMPTTIEPTPVVTDYRRLLILKKYLPDSGTWEIIAIVRPSYMNLIYWSRHGPQE